MADEQLTLEQLHGIQTDPEIEKKVTASLELPRGNYASQPELMLTIRVAPDNALHPGRKSAQFYGFFRGVRVLEEVGEGEKPDPLAVMDPQPAGRASFEVSWEYRDKVDFATKEIQVGKPDIQSKLWHQACKLYRLVNQLPKDRVLDVPEVLTYLQKYSVTVNFMKGENRNIALSISRTKEA